MTSNEQWTELSEGTRMFFFPSTQEHFDSLRSLEHENVEIERFRQRLEAWTGTRITFERDFDHPGTVWFTRHDNGGVEEVTIELIQAALSWDQLVRAVAWEMTENAMTSNGRMHR